MKTLLIICLLILPIITQAQSFREIQTEFRGAALTGLYFLDSTYAIKLKAYLPIKESCQVHILDDYPKMDVLSAWTEAYLNNLPADKKTNLLTVLQRWCKEEALIAGIAHYLHNFNEFSKVIAETPATKHLLNKYLEVPGQYYGSLNFNQGCALYYDMVNYVFKLNKQERLAFYTSYFNTACKIAEEEEKEVTVRGIIKDPKGQPLVGATIHIKNTQRSALADFDGSFSLIVSLNDTLQISYVGFETQESTCSEDSLHIVLKEKEFHCLDNEPVDSLTHIFINKFSRPEIYCIRDVKEIERNGHIRRFKFYTRSHQQGDEYEIVLFCIPGNNQTSNLDFASGAQLKSLKRTRIEI